MGMMILKGFLISLGVLFGLGLIRLMIKHPATFLDAILNVFFIDVLFDILSEIDW